MSDVFISYRRQDRDAAQRVVAALERCALRVWWDGELSVGDDFRDQIRQELDQATCVIVLWSSHSIQAGSFVLSEADRAKQRLLSVRIEDVAPPLGFDQQQYVDLIDWTGDVAVPGFVSLLRSLSRRLQRPFAQLPQQKRALAAVVDRYTQPQSLPVASGLESAAVGLFNVLNSEAIGFKAPLLTNCDADALRRALKALAQETTARDLVLVYFACHARLSAEEHELCFCATNTALDLLTSSGVPISELSKLLDRIPAEHLVLILDCDFSVEPGAGSGVERGHFDVLGRGRGEHVIVSNLPQAAGSAKVDRPVFARALTERLVNFAADKQHDRHVTLDDWYAYARAKAVDAGAAPIDLHFDVSASTVQIAYREATPEQSASAAIRVAPGVAPELAGFLDAVAARLKSRRILPLLGEGLYGSGPLSNFEVIKALAQRNRALRTSETLPMATVAQYVIDNDEDPDAFSLQLRSVLEEQAKQCGNLAVHDLVLAMQRPWVLVSTTYDWLLETRLAAAGVKFSVVSHVMGSMDADSGSGLAVLHSGTPPRFEICSRSDKLLLDDDDCVIYKILGSPFLNDHQPGLNTLVASETDHAVFLGRLQTETTSVPTFLGPALRERSLLYLGYNLDVWHYRMVSRIFGQPGKRRSYAVRQPTSTIEESFWQSLEVQLAPVDAETFAQALLNG